MRVSFYPKNFQHPERATRDLFGDRPGSRSCTGISPSRIDKEDAMRLVADRFLEDDDGRAFDLATGERVVLTIDAAGDAPSQRRWAIRCDALQKLHHRRIVPLVDFGAVGPSSRFEAWRCGTVWPGAREEAQRASNLARLFLLISGLTAGDESLERVHLGSHGAMLLPDAFTGYACDPPDVSPDLPMEARAVAWIERPAITALAEMFHTMSGSRPHLSALWGPAGSGKTTIVRQLARIARVNGFVPVAARLVNSRYAALWHGRSVFVIDDEGDGDAWRALLDTATRNPQPHVLLTVATSENKTIDGIALDRIAPDELAAAVQPAPADRRVAARIRRAAEESRGLPGRFVRALWPLPSGDRRARVSDRLSRVAEQPIVYGAVEAVEIVETLETIGPSANDASDGGRGVTPPAETTASGWPAPGELAMLRRRMDGAVRQLEQGRHEAGLRQLRQAIGGLARRDGWIEAAAGAVVLSSALLRRGRVGETRTALDQARQFASRAGCESTLIDVAVMSGEASIDSARLDEAEAVLTAARSAAIAAGDRTRAAQAALGLGRCLFWRGHYADALNALSPPEGFDETPLPIRLRRGLVMARAAVGQRDFSNAMALVTDAADMPGVADQPSWQSSIAYGSAFVHLAVGDLDAVERDVSTAISASRLAHDPLCAIRARLLLAEADRRRGRTATVNRLGRLTSVTTFPVTIRARGRLVRDLLAAGSDAPAIVGRHVGATGLGALALYAPDAAAARPPGVGVDDSLVRDVINILRLCQTAEEEGAVLKEVCARVRQQLHASAISCVAATAGRHDVIAAEGARIEPGIAERAIAAGITIAPYRGSPNGRIEAAAPVQYGGDIVGAVCARWTLGSTYDLTRAATVLTMTAAAVAPLLSAAIAWRERPAQPALNDLRGVTPAVVDLRHAAERAASAPFPVLIEGESGSGKELVARAIHRAGARRERPFCTLNCAALPDDLVEAELFGHARGAFTGAIGDRAGVFEEAHGGTLFLDEVGELSPRAQAKLLRVIQEGELRRVGESISRRVDVRIVSATNRDLRQEVTASRFRMDLLYRLDVIRISVPPLRDRRDDIALLAEHFWRDATARVGSRATLGAATIAALAGYDWPGNVRELQNVLAALAVRCPKRGSVAPTALPPHFVGAGPSESWRLEEARRSFEERFIRAALVRSGGHRTRAAIELGVSRQGLTKLMSRLGIAEGDDEG
jgi:DNA-binding NtrC family response regulator